MNESTRIALQQLERVLWAGGLACLALVLAAWVEAGLFQHRAERAIGVAALPAVDRAVPAGTPLAVLRIPRLELRAVVAEGTSKGVLRRAVGHLTRSARPGEGGNVVLAAHRDTFFRPLEEIRAGDEIALDAGGERHLYTVEWTRVFDPASVEVADDPGYPSLTLVTCYPFRWVGPAPQRFVVRARREPALGAGRAG